MYQGEKIKAARKRAGKTAGELGKEIGFSKSAISVIESDGLKNGPDPTTLVKIAAALNDLSILAEHCLACPVRQTLFIRQFPDLNNIRRDPAIITSRLRKEMVEAATALEELAEVFSDKDFRSRPGFSELFASKMEQVIDAERGIEILKHELVVEGHISGKELKFVYGRQQKKCEDRGHHLIATEDAA